jgi:tetratricopeptide (TPR) repeat protein
MSLFEIVDRALRRRSNLRQCSVDELVSMGDLWSKRNNPARAERYYRHCLRVDPNAVQAMTGLGLICMNRNDHEGTAYWFDAALRVDPLHIKCYYVLGIAHLQRSDLVSAHEALQNWLSFAPQEETDRETDGRIDEARKICEAIENKGGLLYKRIPVRYAFPMDKNTKPRLRGRPDAAQLSLELFDAQSHGAKQHAIPLSPPIISSEPSPAAAPKPRALPASVDILEPAGDSALPLMTIAFVGCSEDEGFSEIVRVWLENDYAASRRFAYIHTPYLDDLPYVLDYCRPDSVILLPVNNILVRHGNNAFPDRFDKIYEMIHGLSFTHKIPVIAASALTESLPGHADRIIESGAKFCFGMPFNQREMAKAIMSFAPVKSGKNT